MLKLIRTSLAYAVAAACNTTSEPHGSGSSGEATAATDVPGATDVPAASSTDTAAATHETGASSDTAAAEPRCRDGTVAVGEACWGGHAIPLPAPEPVRGSLVYDLQVADLDGDAKSEIVVAYAEKTDGGFDCGLTSLSFTTAFDLTLGPVYPDPATYCASSLALRDLDGDDRIDVLLSGIREPKLLRGLGDGRFEPMWTAPPPPGVEDAGAIGDFDADGRLDLVLRRGPARSPEEEGLVVWLQRKNGRFEAVPLVPNARQGGLPSGRLGIGDLDGVRGDDLVQTDVRLNVVDVWLSRGDGSFDAARSVQVHGELRVARVGDVMGDAQAELIVQVARAEGSAIEVYALDDAKNPERLRSHRIPGPPRHGLDGVLADVDRDGRLDGVFLVTTGVWILRGFDRPEPDLSFVAVGQNVLSLDVGDLNGDGAVDIVLGGGSTKSADPLFLDPVWIIQQIP